MLALRSHLDGDDAAALARYREVLARYPDDKHVNALAANLLLAHGDKAGAVPFLEQAVAIDPFFEKVVRDLVHALGALGRKDALRERLAAWSRLPPNPALRGARVRSAVWLGDLDGALDAAPGEPRRSCRPLAARRPRNRAVLAGGVQGVGGVAAAGGAGLPRPRAPAPARAHDAGRTGAAARGGATRRRESTNPRTVRPG